MNLNQFSSMYHKRTPDAYARCKKCDRIYHSMYEKDHPRERKAYTTKIRVRQRDEIRQLKESTPCKDCGMKFAFYQMQFDHVDRSTKKFNVAALLNSARTTALKEEIAKCDIVCANCHAKRTFLRGRYINNRYAKK